MNANIPLAYIYPTSIYTFRFMLLSKAVFSVRSLTCEFKRVHHKRRSTQIYTRSNEKCQTNHYKVNVKTERKRLNDFASRNRYTRESVLRYLSPITVTLSCWIRLFLADCWAHIKTCFIWLTYEWIRFTWPSTSNIKHQHHQRTMKSF